jgi:hypothetical protein
MTRIVTKFQQNATKCILIFNRHGHRAPSSKLGHIADEPEFWNSKLPSNEVLNKLEQFPIKVHSSNSLQTDLKSKPFGCLSSKGVEHLQQRGIM